MNREKLSCLHKNNLQCFFDNNKNISGAANQHIRMISERSCDTEGRSNALHYRYKLHLKILNILVDEEIPPPPPYYIKCFECLEKCYLTVTDY